MICNRKRLKDTHEQQDENLASQSRGWKKRAPNRQLLIHTPLRTLISYNKPTTVQTLEHGHECLGLSENNPTSMYEEANWHAQVVTRVLD